MTEKACNIRQTPENGADASQSPEAEKRMPADRSSRGWSPPDRAPRLRRVADLLMLRADSSPYPDRVRRLARDMRLRAAELEIGAEATYQLEDAEDEIQLLSTALTLV